MIKDKQNYLSIAPEVQSPQYISSEYLSTILGRAKDSSDGRQDWLVGSILRVVAVDAVHVETYQTPEPDGGFTCGNEGERVVTTRDSICG